MQQLQLREEHQQTQGRHVNLQRPTSLELHMHRWAKQKTTSHNMLEENIVVPNDKENKFLDFWP